MDAQAEEPNVATSSRVTLDDVASPSPAQEEIEVGKDEDEELDDTEEEDEDEEDSGAYERERQRQIRENQLLLNSLGIAPGTPLSASDSANAPSKTSAPKRGRPKVKPHRTVYDRSGYIVSLPGPGERHRLACVEMPVDRQLARQIQEGKYADCEDWWEGEERRWRFGDGQGVLAEGEEEEVGGVTKEFRWRKWRGLEKELRREMKQKNKINKQDKAGVVDPAVASGEVSSYSLIPGDACHQCRRKSDKLKMRCRNVNPVCRAVFCETCCKRYSYFDFDPESRSFICPLCKDCCNCGNCIRKHKLTHLLGGKTGVRSKTINREGMTVQAWLEKGMEDKVNVPFERVRLVDQLYDIISPELPPEEKPAPVKAAPKRKAKVEKGPKQPKTKKPKKVKEAEKKGEEEPVSAVGSLVIKLKLPKPIREKEVDSDGDTVRGYSDDDDAKSDASSELTDLSGSERGGPYTNDNDYLANIAMTDQRPMTLASLADTSHDPLTPASTKPVRPVPPSRGSSVSSKGARQRKRPPPTANIVRIPRHALQPPPTALPSSISTAVEQTPTLPAMSFQSFSYDGYSSIPPSELPQHPSDSQGYHPQGHFPNHGLPPPYSHSPPNNQVYLPQQHQHGPYMPMGQYHQSPPTQLTNLDMAGYPGHMPGHGVGIPHLSQDGYGHGRVMHYESHSGEAMWFGPAGEGPMTENGMTMDRRYYPGYS